MGRFNAIGGYFKEEKKERSILEYVKKRKSALVDFEDERNYEFRNKNKK